MKKTHRTPPGMGGGKGPGGPHGKGPGGPYGPHGGPRPADPEREAFNQSLSGRSAKENREFCERYDNEMDPEVLRYWEAWGVRKELFDAEVSDGRSKYSVHTPLFMEPERRYPLVYFSHGGNGTPFQAETAGFSKLIAKEQFIAVYPFNGGYSNEDAATEFPRILNALREKGYPIDFSRVYAAGFSSGSDATESIGTLWPELVAAVAPCPGSNAMYNSLCRVTPEAYDKCRPLQVPMLCVGGTKDDGDKFPFPDPECIDNFNIWAQDISKVAGYEKLTFEESRALAESCDDPTNKAVGLRFHKTWTQHFEERDWFVGEYYDKKGAPVIRFVVGDGVPHVMTGCFARVVWDWLKRWSRDLKTGELIYDGSKEADGGSSAV